MGTPWLPRPTIAMFPDLGHSEAIRTIDGHDQLVRIWTPAQWRVIPHADRPPLAQPIGDHWFDTTPVRTA